MKADELYQQLADIRTNGENAIRAIFKRLGVKKLNITYYEEEYDVETAGFSSYDSNGYSNPSYLDSVEILEDGGIKVILYGDWECETYVDDMTANEVVNALDILEQCASCIVEQGADIISEYPES